MGASVLARARDGERLKGSSRAICPNNPGWHGAQCRV